MTASGKYPDLQCNQSIVLVGMMGAGKTTVGRRLAPRLGLPFFDADEEIEKAAGMGVSELFQTHGEESFRKGEAKVIARLLSGRPLLLSAGGGALTAEETRRIVKEKAISIWLKADLDTLARRATRRGNRPLLKSGDPRETLKRLMAEREEQYAIADIHVESQLGAHEMTVDLIMDTLRSYLRRTGQATGKPSP